MASEIRIEFIGEGFGEILRSEGTRNLVQDTVDRIGDKANANNTRGGEGFRKSVEQSTRTILAPTWAITEADAV